jgi:ribosomal protein S18 acetylase RimI-like enzyme
MVPPFHEMTFPEKGTSDIRIRNAHVADASSIAKVRIASWRSTYRGIIPHDYLESLSAQEYTGHWQGILAANGRQGYTYVAEHAGGIIGFALGGVERSQDPIFRGEIYALYLLEAYQHRGIGRKLVAAIAGYLMQENINSMLVWVLSENPAQAFYEVLGGKQIYEKPIMISGKEFKQIAYGWKELSPLADSHKHHSLHSGEEKSDARVT